MTSTGAGAVYPIAASTKAYYISREREVPAKSGKTENIKYDSISLSTQKGGDRNFMDMVSRMSYEVRTSTTNGDIQALRQQVSAGEYAPDAYNIAARMLMLGDEL